MQLINDLSDLPRFANLLTPEYKQKLTNDINALLIKYMDEQAKITTPPVVEKKESLDLNFDDFSSPKPEEKPIITPPVISPVAPKPPENIFKPNLMSNLSKPGFPPPPPPIHPPGGIVNNQMKLKPSSLLQRPSIPVAKKAEATKFISMFESLGHIMPVLNEAGVNAAQRLPVNSEPSKFLKQVDGSTTLKQVYMIIYPPSVSVIEFLEKTMQINSSNLMNFKSAGNIPSDTDVLLRLGDLLIALGFIDESILESALLFQRRDTRNIQGDDELMHYDAAEARKEDNKKLKKEKPLLGDILVDMKVVSQQQIVQALKIQTWYRAIVDRVRD